MKGEDVEDEYRTIDHLDLQLLLQVALLGWRELIVKDEHVQPELLDEGRELFYFALADIGRWAYGIKTLLCLPNDLNSGSVRELGQLVQRVFQPPKSVRPTRLCPNEKGPLGFSIYSDRLASYSSPSFDIRPGLCISPGAVRLRADDLGAM